MGFGIELSVEICKGNGNGSEHEEKIGLEWGWEQGGHHRRRCR